MASRRGTFLGVLAALFLVSFARAAEPTGKPIVRETTAVDGVTRLREATVDGLPLETYLQILAGLRRLVDLPA